MHGATIGCHGARPGDAERWAAAPLKKRYYDSVGWKAEERYAPQAAIEEMVRRLAERFAPERIILFGSHARGDAQRDSDVDLLVLFAEVEDPRKRAAEMYEALSGLGVAKDIVVSTTAQFERYKNVANTVHWPAAREGKILYERAA